MKATPTWSAVVCWGQAGCKPNPAAVQHLPTGLEPSTCSAVLHSSFSLLPSSVRGEESKHSTLNPQLVVDTGATRLCLQSRVVRELGLLKEPIPVNNAQPSTLRSIPNLKHGGIQMTEEY